MKSGQSTDNRLIGPGDNNYGREDKQPLAERKIITELTPELSEKIWKGITTKMHNQALSKKEVLHHLKQLKAQMGKYKKANYDDKCAQIIIENCMEMIDKKILKINKL